MARSYALTKREAEVFRRLLDAKTTKEIARELQLSPKTIEVHRAAILQKHNVRNTIELVIEHYRGRIENHIR